jgi:DNA-binding MarR family transcriptional regulator
MPLTNQEARFLEWLRDHGSQVRMDKESVLALAKHVGVQSQELGPIATGLASRNLIHRAAPDDPFERDNEGFVVRLLEAGKEELNAHLEAGNEELNTHGAADGAGSGCCRWLKFWAWPIWRS